MSPSPDELFSDLLDGQPVAPEALEIALADPAARAVLVDFVRLRHLLGEPARPRDAFYRAAVGELAAARRSPWRRPLAAVLLLGLAVALWLSFSVPREPAVEDRPPEAAKVLYFEPGVDWDPAA